MVKISVDYSKFTKVANSLEQYTFAQNQQMSKATMQVQQLNQSWKGADYNAFKTAWVSIEQNDSVTKAFEKSLTNYASVLKATANEYKTAQQTAIDLANKI